jgi:hypothetical protein
MGVVVWGYRGGVGTLRIRCKLSTYGKFRHMISAIVIYFYGGLYLEWRK